MNKIRIALLSLAAMFLLTSPAMAQSNGAYIEFSGALGAGLVCIGSAFGIGRIASTAVENMARQPEVAGQISTSLIIAAALIEGFTFFALVICMQQNPFA